MVLCALMVPANGSIPLAAWSTVARYEFEYRVAVNDPAPGRMSVWIPYPPDNDAQRVLDAKVESPLKWRLTTEKKFGNRIAYLQGKGPLKGEVVLRFLVERRPFRGIPRDAAAPGTPLDP